MRQAQHQSTRHRHRTARQNDHTAGIGDYSPSCTPAFSSSSSAAAFAFDPS